jgi:hypothetical protein
VFPLGHSQRFEQLPAGEVAGPDVADFSLLDEQVEGGE